MKLVTTLSTTLAFISAMFLVNFVITLDFIPQATAANIDKELPKFEVSDVLIDIETQTARSIIQGSINYATASFDKIKESEEDIVENNTVYYDYVEPQYYSEPQIATYSYSGNDYGNSFKSEGVVQAGDTTYTWYSQNVLPGSGLTELNNNGRHVESNGFIYDGDGYIAVASDEHAVGDVVSTPWGDGKVYDTGSGSGNIDIYTDF